MNTNMTATNDIRELTIDETDSVSGGNPLAAAAYFFGAWLATKTLNSLGEGKSVQDLAKDYAQGKKGGKQPQ